MADVFISYSRDNQEIVRKLAEAVKRAGYSLWWDDELPPHLAYGDVIAEKVGRAKAAIVVWSAAAAASEWVRAEADMARGQKKLIQTSIDDRMPPMPFNQLHFASLADWDGGDDHPGWRKVKESLVAMCGPPGGEATVPATAAASPAAAPAVPTPAPAPAPAPRPTVSAPAPRAASGNSNRLLIAAIAISLLVIAAVGVLAFLRGREAPQAAENQAAPAGLPSATPQPIPVVAPPPGPAAEQFAMSATIEDADGYANVRSGPSAGAPIVARVNEGETVMTYSQDGAWWRVRIGGGLVGYVERARLRPAVASPPMVTVVPPAAPPAPRAAERPRPQPPTRRPAGPRINEANAGVMREYCKGPGAGTPPCRRFEGGGRRR